MVHNGSIINWLLGYERARTEGRNMGTGRERGHRAHNVEDIDKMHGQQECAEGTGRRHGQRARAEGMDRRHGQRA